MSESNIDIFKQLEQDFVGFDLPEMPPDPLQEILLRSIDPIDGAMRLQEYVDTLSDEATEHIVREATSALRYKHSNEFTDPDKSLQVLVTLCAAFPEQDPKRRIRDVTTRKYLTGYNYVRGSFNNIVSMRTVNHEEGRVRYTPAIIMQCPEILDAYGNASTEIELPDYIMFSITSVHDGQYSFIELDQ